MKKACILLVFSIVFTLLTAEKHSDGLGQRESVPGINPVTFSIYLNALNQTKQTPVQVSNSGSDDMNYLLKERPPIPQIAGYTLLGIYNGHRYYLSNTTSYWAEAKQACINAGGHMVTMSDAAENNFIINATHEVFWVGITDEVSEGTWRWITGETSTFRYWNAGEPNNYQGLEHYAQTTVTGRWNDTAHFYDIKHLLEIDSIPVGTMLSFSPSSGAIGANSSTVSTMTINGTSLIDGIYQTHLNLLSNSPTPNDSLEYPVTIYVDYTPPLQVQGLTGIDSQTDADQIAVEWTANAVQDGVVNYRIYRKGEYDNNWMLINTVSAATLSYIDRAFTPMDSTYVYYRVTALDSFENESTPSNSIIASLKRYNAPENLSIIIQNSRHVYLSWDAVTQTISGMPGTPSCYIIYKSDHALPLAGYDFLNISLVNNFTHLWAAYFQPANRLFYFVTAYGGDLNEARAIIDSRNRWKYEELSGLLK